MSDFETRLDRALKAGAPAPRDPMFRIAVMAKREQAALRRRLWTAGATALGAVILAALGLGVLNTLPVADRLGAAAAGGVVLAALLAAPWLGGGAAVRGLMARASSTLRTLPRPNFWP